MSYTLLIKRLTELVKSTATAQDAGGAINSAAEAFGLLAVETAHADDWISQVQIEARALIQDCRTCEDLEKAMQTARTRAIAAAASMIEAAAIAERAAAAVRDWRSND